MLLLTPWSSTFFSLFLLSTTTTVSTFDWVEVNNLDGQGGQQANVPAGYVKLPEQYQQKKYFYNGYNVDGSFNDLVLADPNGLDPCASSPPPPCPWPSSSMSQQFYYDTVTRTCVPLSYSACLSSSNGDLMNIFDSFEACMGSCLALGTCSLCDSRPGPRPVPGPVVVPEGGFEVLPSSPSLPSSSSLQEWHVCQDGSVIPSLARCNGIAECPFGDDELYCWTNPTDSNPSVSLVVDLDDSSLAQALTANARVLVNFYTKSCSFCTHFEPQFELAASQYSSSGLSDLVFARVDVDENPWLLQQFRVAVFPKVLLWDQINAPHGVPRQFYRGYGLRAERLLQWLRLQFNHVQLNAPLCQRVESLFTCDNGLKCVHEGSVCDGNIDCRDNTDEFFCDDDDDDQAHDESQTQDVGQAQGEDQAQDEDQDVAEEPTDTEVCDFRCGSDLSCHSNSERCDGKMDCDDNVDEAGCPTYCSRTQHTCTSDRVCIDYLRRCDGYRDCEDGSDERLCQESECSKTEFVCLSGMQCVNFARRCDGRVDCYDHSDELLCPKPCNASSEFTCNDGSCVALSSRCDGVSDCVDSTDEIDCSNEMCSGAMEWRCGDGRGCIDVRRRCDGYPDCADQSDESLDLCPNMECNAEWQWQCSDNRRCIDKRRRCDAYDDCLDRSDEENCLQVECDYWQLKCKSDGICVDERRRCDGVNDCVDASDEQDCFNTNEDVNEDVNEDNCPKACPYIYAPVCGSDGVTYASQCQLEAIVCEERREVYAIHNGECYDEGNNEDNTEGNNEGNTEESVEDGCNLECQGNVYEPVCGSDGVSYANECQMETLNCRENNNVYVVTRGECGTNNNEQETTTSTTEAPPRDPCLFPCPAIYAPVCGSDGVTYANDCQLRSVNCREGRNTYIVSEGECSLNNECEEFEMQCDDGQCIGMEKQCDGVQDCDNGEDELFCQQNDDGDQTNDDDEVIDNDTDFVCSDGLVVAKTAVCDGFPDCDEGEDEADCQLQVQDDYDDDGDNYDDNATDYTDDATDYTDEATDYTDEATDYDDEATDYDGNSDADNDEDFISDYDEGQVLMPGNEEVSVDEGVEEGVEVAGESGTQAPSVTDEPVGGEQQESDWFDDDDDTLELEEEFGVGPSEYVDYNDTGFEDTDVVEYDIDNNESSGSDEGIKDIQTTTEATEDEGIFMESEQMDDFEGADGFDDNLYQYDNYDESSNYDDINTYTDNYEDNNEYEDGLYQYDYGPLEDEEQYDI